MEPVTMIAISSVLRGLSSISQGMAASDQYKAFGAANDYNAAVLRQRAETTERLYGNRESAQRRQSTVALGKMRAAIGQSGVGYDGSNADVAFQSELAAELDALNINYEGTLEARALRNQAVQESYQGETNRWAAKRARLGGFLGAAGSALSGASRMSGYGAPSGPTQMDMSN